MLFRYIGKGQGSNRTSCLCKEGTWRHDGLPGRPCFDCPEGGICEGEAKLPFPKENYWAASSNGRLTIYASDPAGIDNLDADPPIFLSCPAGQCKGGKDYACVPGYTGVQCNECVVGTFQFKAACDISCEDIEPASAFGVVTIFGILAVMIVWIVLNKSAGGLFECLDVGLSFMQVGRYPVPLYPRYPVSAVRSWGAWYPALRADHEHGLHLFRKVSQPQR